MTLDQQQLINIYEHTKDICQKIKFKTPILYNIKNIHLNNIKCKNNNTISDPIIEICNEDTLNMAIRYKENNLNPLVLNMASDICPGGGVRKGSMAQEECIFRRTNAFQTHYYEFYPLSSSQIIYSPSITIVKDSNYNLLKKYINISMISVPAIRNPQLINKKYKEFDYILMFNKIESIFKVAIINNHDSLVLGALGCGAFNNPPHEVARIFKILIDKYKSFFKYIGFAILVVKDKDNINISKFTNIILNK